MNKKSLSPEVFSLACTWLAAPVIMVGEKWAKAICKAVYNGRITKRERQ